MERRRTGVAGSAVVASATVLCVGCSPAPINSDLWLQLDRQQNVVYGLFRDPLYGGSDPDTFLSELGQVADYWDGVSYAEFVDPADGTTVFYNVREPVLDEVGDPVLTYDLFVASGRAPGDDGARGWLDTRPVSAYTCYQDSVTFTADTISSHVRSHDYGEDRLECPAELVDALGAGAQYREPQEFDG